MVVVPETPQSASTADDLALRASRAFGWSVLNTAVGRLGTVGIGIALARLLGPESFGTFAVATVALLAVLSFNELGISLAIVRWPGDPDRIAPTVATMSVVSSVLLFALCWFCTPGFTALMGDSSATPVVRVMLVCLIVNGVVAAPAALMQRSFMQKKRMLIDQVGVWSGAGLSVVLAVGGAGAMSLAIGRLAASILTAILFWTMAPGGRRLGLDRSLLGPLLSFGLPLAGASAVVFAAGYADQFAVGSLLGSTELGFYVLAFNVAAWPTALFGAPLRAVAPALFAAIQDDSRRLAETFERLAVVVMAVVLPVCVGIAAAARPIVELLYGAEWARSAPVLVWLALFAALRTAYELAYDYLVVLRKSASLFWVQVWWAVMSLPFLVFGALIGGIGGVAFAQLVAAVLFAGPVYAAIVGAEGVDLGWVLRRVALSAVACGLLWIVLTRVWTPNSSMAACGAAGLVTVAVLSATVAAVRRSIAHLSGIRTERTS